MSINIKNPKTTRLARELANLTGETMTEAITQALEERLGRMQREALRERWLRIIAETPESPGIIRSDQIDDWLYDERGLPK